MNPDAPDAPDVPDVPDALVERLAASWEPVRAYLQAELGAEIAAWEHVSPRRPEGHHHGAYRLDLADGRRVKLRLVRQAQQAELMQTILGECDEPRFPPLLFRHDRCVLETWVDGTPLDADDARAPAEAGDLLGRLHARRTLAGAELPTRVSTASDLALLLTQLDELRAAGLLSTDAARRLHDDAVHHDPGVTAHGLFHGDLCGENMLRDAHGGLHVIDNERLRPGSPAHDLVRTQYRWPLDAPARAAFAAAYATYAERHVGPHGDAAEQHFWHLRTLIQSAHVRGLRWQGDASEPLRALSALLA